MQIENKAKLFKVRRTVFQMLNDRGYKINKKEIDESLEVFKEKYNRNYSINISFSKKDLNFQNFTQKKTIKI